MYNSAIDTAARFGDIPFVEFTKELVTGVFDSLVDAHIIQMEEYATFVNSLTQDLSTYINNTQDNVSFEEISDFILGFELPEPDSDSIANILGNLESPDTSISTTSGSGGSSQQPAAPDEWWGGLINALAPAITSLIDKIEDPNEVAGLEALNNYNNAVLDSAEDLIPSYQEIHDAIAALIASNKYGLLQTMANQGMMRLVVTEGEIETKITFSTWNNSTRTSESDNKVKEKTKTKDKRGIYGRIFKGRDKTKNRIVTVNTAKSYQRDSSGTKVDIFGRVLIKFKTDYAPLNG